MRGDVPSFNLVTPPSLQDALKLLADKGAGLQPFAGGTDLMVQLESGHLKHKQFLNILSLKELHGIKSHDDYIDIGACETYSQIQKNPDIRKEFPSLIQAGSETGGWAIQNRGTLGGNIANASPAADSPPALLSYDAQIRLLSTNGERWVPYHKFHSGYKVMDLNPGELITTVRLPRTSAGTFHFYQKAGTRLAQAISKVVFAATGRVDAAVVKDVRIALGSVAPITLRCSKTEAVLRGKVIDDGLIDQAAQMLATEITPMDDIRSTKLFRLEVSKNLLRKFLRGLSSHVGLD